MTIQDVKLYLRVDSSDEDSLIASLMTAAQLYLVRMTGKAYVPTDDVWNLGIKLLCSHWYENRDDMVDGRDAKVDHSIDSIVQQIALCTDYPCSTAP